MSSASTPAAAPIRPRRSASYFFLRGVAITLQLQVEIGDLIQVDLPFPVRVKGVELKRVQAVVRRIAVDTEGRIVGLEFVEPSATDPPAE